MTDLTTMNSPDIQADRVMSFVAAMYDEDPTNTADLLRYILCDLRHFADKRDLDFAVEDKRAHLCYLAERQKQPR